MQKNTRLIPTFFLISYSFFNFFKFLFCFCCRYTKAAKAGHVAAECALGKCYRKGRGMDAADAEEAVKWYTKAADKGNVKAQASLGLCYERGTGVAKDIEKAREW